MLKPISTQAYVYLTGREVKDRYRIGNTTLYEWCNNSDFPSPYKLGPKLSRWKLSELEAWEEKSGKSEKKGGRE